MRLLARFATRNPVPILVVWIGVFLASLALGGNARDDLHETNLQIPGTKADRAAKITEDRFGGSLSLAVLLKAPPGQERLLAREGPRLADRLERIEGVQVLSPFAIGGNRVLREPRGQALFSLQVRRSQEDISDETVPAVQRELDRVRPPLETELSGRAPLVRALNEESLNSLDKGELIAFPILIVLLLLVFRSPIAALVPLMSGLFVTRIGTGAMSFLNDWFALDALALNMLTMIGLALGVDYSLLIVSRFREELAAGASVSEALEEALARAGRTVVFAGTALAVGMLGALLIAPGNLLVSATIGVIVACVLAVAVGLLAIPASLALLGTRVNSWQLWSARRENPWVRLSERLSSKPGIAVLLTTLPLLFLSAPALALDTGPPNVENLPPENSARKSYEEFERDRGAGWATPFEVTFTGNGPMTTDRRLRRLTRFEKQAAKQKGVEAVLGPADLLDRTRILRQITRSVVTGQVQIARLERSLRRLVRGQARLDAGLEQASAGSQALADGLGQAATGSGQIAGGTAAAVPQTQQLANGVQQTSKGADQLASASGRANSGARRLDTAIDELTRVLTQEDSDFEAKLSDPLDSAQSDVQAALRNLGSASPAAQADPFVQRARQSISQALTSLGTVQSNLSSYATELNANTAAAKEISRGMQRLVTGLAQISSGSTQLDSGVARTASGATQLASGAGVLNAGVQQLNSGINQLHSGGAEGSGGAVGLAGGLDRASAGANAIGRGLQRLLDNVVAVRQANDRQEGQLRRQGIDVGKAAASGYFVLAGIEGAEPQSRSNAGFAINTDSGGNTARVIVIPDGGAFDEDTQALRKPLEDLAAKTAKDLGGEAEGVVGGPAVLLDDFDQATSARFPLLVATLVLVTFLVLLIVFRAPILALIAVLLNLVTVGAAVGILIIGFQSDPPIFGGPGYLDAIALSGIFAIIFGLSIDYEVFLLSRLVEGRALTGTTEGAIRYGLEKTATIITGAAAVMAFVFLAFAVSPVANTRQFGIGLTVAVVLDATVVRLILLPALIRLFGERTWAVPAWLDRILPKFQTH